jgi:hypothetical protein
VAVAGTDAGRNAAEAMTAAVCSPPGSHRTTSAPREALPPARAEENTDVAIR